MILSYCGCLIALIAAAPSVVFGAIARATNWNETDYGKVPRAPLPGELKEDDTRSARNLTTFHRTYKFFFALLVSAVMLGDALPYTDTCTIQDWGRGGGWVDLTLIVYSETHVSCTGSSKQSSTQILFWYNDV